MIKEKAALHIQVTYRCHLLKNEILLLSMSTVHKASVQEEIDALGKQIKDKKNYLVSVDVERKGLTEKASARIEMVSITECAITTCECASPGTSFYTKRMTSLLTVPVRVGSFMDIFYNETNLTRQGMTDFSVQVKQDNTPASIHTLSAKSVLESPHYPLLTASLPLPKGVYTFASRHGKYNINATQGLSQNHTIALKKHFHLSWHEHVTIFIAERDVTIYDFLDKDDKYAGSVILSKFLVRSRGRISPLVSIESIVSATKENGCGSVAFEFCKALLFTDVEEVPHGHIVAQCMKNIFWSSRLDITADGRCIVMQLLFMFSSYEIEKTCDLRFKTFFANDDGRPSPAKMARA